MPKIKLHHPVTHYNAFNTQNRLARLPEDLGYDVCGIPSDFIRPKKFFVTHTHLDHLPARANLTLVCAPPLRVKLEKLYAKEKTSVNLEEYPDFFPTEHIFFNRGSGRLEKAKSYGYLIKDLAVIPESNEFERLITEYKPKSTVIILFKQPREHLPTKLITARTVENCYFADPTSWSRYAPNVLPKIVLAIIDVRSGFIHNDGVGAKKGI